MDRAKMPLHALMAGLFCGCAAYLISGFSLSAIWAVYVLSGMAPPPSDWSYYLVFYFKVATVPAVIGFLCGIFLRSYLLLRSRYLPSRFRMIVEAAVIGPLLSTLVPLTHALQEGRGDRSDWKIALLLIAVIGPVSILYAAIVHHRL